MVDLTRDEHGDLHARLLDAVQGRSGTVYADWLKAAGLEVTVTVEHAALDPFRGYANAIRDQLPDAVAVLDAFHVVKLGSTALDEVRRRVQQDTLHRRGHRDDPLYRIRRTLMTGVEHLTDRQQARLDRHLPAGDPNGEVRLAWQAYQRLRAIYHATSPDTGRRLAEQLIEVLHTCPVPELARLGRTLLQWRTQILAYFATGGVNNGGTEAVCECLTGWSGTGWSDGSGRADRRVTLEAIGPLRRCSSVELSTLGSAAGTVRPTSVT